jgi:hypothetical protein
VILLDPIDVIARKKQCDVLYLKFLLADEDRNDWEKSTVRSRAIGWLEENGVKWKPCAPFADGFLQYEGDIFVDVPHDAMHEKFQLLQRYCGNVDESSCIHGCTVHVLPLDVAMSKAYQDDPGYWENY